MKKMNKIYYKLFLFLFLGTINCFSQSNKNEKVADSLYISAWDKYNAGEFKEAIRLFEKSIEMGYNHSVVYLNLASSCANENDKERTFLYLHKMVEANFLEKRFIIENSSEFYKYYESEEWSNFIEHLDEKRNTYEQYFKSNNLRSHLSKEQMHQDFDTLINTINKVSPHLRVRDVVCNLNSANNFIRYRNEIKNINSYSDFALLINRTLISCQDGHTSLTQGNVWKCLSDGNTKEYCFPLAKNAMLFNSVRTTNKNLPKLVYHKGKYFTSSEYKYKSILLPTKTELLKINNLEPSEYLKQNIDKKSSLSWDFNEKNFYSKNLLLKNITTDSILQLTFLDKQRKIDFNVKLEVGNKQNNKISRPKNGEVWYWNKKELLYIRMPNMSDGKFYYDKILEYKDSIISKVVIDVRHNPGGSDGSFYYVLNALSDVNLSIKTNMAFNKGYISLDSTSLVEKFKELDIENTIEHKTIPNPPFDNINYNGKVYVFYDENTFSSAGSLVNTCYYDENLVAVGVNTGRILGFGIRPKHFTLPNSQLTFRVELVLDITNCNNYQDIFHDSPEIDVKLNLDEKIILENNNYSKEFIKEKDPYIQRIIK